MRVCLQIFEVDVGEFVMCPVETVDQVALP
jgi:hypothetical protein